MDIDHIIPLSRGGPDLPWNTWALCLRDHRLKTLWEAKLFRLVREEKYCFACGKVESKFFQSATNHAFFCRSCAAHGERVSEMRNFIKSEILKSIQSSEASHEANEIEPHSIQSS